MPALEGIIDGGSFAQLGTGVDWLVDGLIRRGTVTLISGDPGSKKTWFALELVRAVATGTPFLGKFQTQRGAAFGLMADSGLEDVAGQWKRLINDELVAHYADGLEAIGSDPFADRVRMWCGSGLRLDDESMMNLLAEDMLGVEHSPCAWGRCGPLSSYVDADGEFDSLGFDQDFVAFYDSGVSLVVIDSLSATSQAEENSNESMSRVMSHVRAFASKTNAAVILIHHMAKPNGSSSSALHRSRGASSIVASADAVFSLEAKDQFRTRVTIPKMRARAPVPFDFELRYDDTRARLGFSATGTREEQDLVDFIRCKGIASRPDCIGFVAGAGANEADRMKAQSRTDKLLKHLLSVRQLEKVSHGVYRAPSKETPSRGKS